MYTPGPWEIKRTCQGIPEVHSKSRPVAKPLFYMGSEDREVEANACLISAAPKMYEALRIAEWVGVEKTGYVVHTVHYHCPVCGNRQEEGHAPECLLQKALAKAEGRA